jgi:hypothetical protein
LLPAGVSRVLQRRFPHAKVTELADLHADDRKLWLASPDRKGACPGVAIGHFEYPDRLSYAVLLIRRHRGKTYNTLVLASQSGRKQWQLHVLKKEWLAEPFPTVVWAMPPGRYDNWDTTKRVRITMDGIVNEGIESWTVMYYWWRGRWRTIQLSG